MSQPRLPIHQVAKILHTTPLNIFMHIKRGHLTGEEIDGAWWIDHRSLELFLEASNETGVPAICVAGCSRQHSCKGCG